MNMTAIRRHRLAELQDARTRRRAALLDLAQSIARRARRARRADVLDRVRAIGEQVNAVPMLGLTSPAAGDVLDAALTQLVRHLEVLDA